MRRWVAGAGFAAGISLAAHGLAAELGEGPVELSAEAGQIVHLERAAPRAPGSVEGALRLLELRGATRWAPSAFVGLRGDEGKFRVFVTQPERGGPLVAGYDYVLDGRVVTRETVVREIPRTAAVEVALTWTRTGTVTVSFYGGAPRRIETLIRPVELFAAASSARVKFSLSVDSFL